MGQYSVCYIPGYYLTRYSPLLLSASQLLVLVRRPAGWLGPIAPLVISLKLQLNEGEIPHVQLHNIRIEDCSTRTRNFARTNIFVCHEILYLN